MKNVVGHSPHSTKKKNYLEVAEGYIKTLETECIRLMMTLAI